MSVGGKPGIVFRAKVAEVTRDRIVLDPSAADDVSEYLKVGGYYIFSATPARERKKDD